MCNLQSWSAAPDLPPPAEARYGRHRRKFQLLGIGRSQRWQQGAQGLETLRGAVRIFEAMTENEDIDGLAAEYALGTLDPAERRQVDERKRTDASLSAAIEAWEQRLGTLNERAGDIEPPARLLDDILARISSQAAA